MVKILRRREIKGEKKEKTNLQIKELDRKKFHLMDQV